MSLTPILKAKGQLTKANQTKARMENLARELQKVPLYSAFDDIANNLYRITSDSGCAPIAGIVSG